MIYAIEALGTGFIKFGKAHSVGKRLVALECANPFELHILAVANWPDGAEKSIHRLLEPMHQRGEWFKDGKLTREVISWMTNGEAGLERLHSEMPLKKSRAKLVLVDNTTTTVDESSTDSVRRAERIAYWKARERVSNG